MRILLVNDFGYPVGGAESYFFGLADALRARGHSVTTVSSDSTRHGQTFLTDYQLRHCGHWLNSDSIFNPITFAQFRKLISHVRPEVVHVQNFFYTLTPAIFFALGRARAVVTLHDYAAICAGDKRLVDGRVCQSAFAGACRVGGCLEGKSALTERLRRSVLRRGLNRAHCLLAPSEFLRSEFERNGFQSVSLLRHPITEVGSSPAAVHAMTSSASFVYVGRLVAQKGVSVLLKAFAEVRRQLPDAQLSVIGSGPLESVLAADADLLGLGNSVRFLGRVAREQVFEQLSGATALVLPSLWPEVAGLAMYEAALCGVPSVASAIGGIPEFVIPERTGLLVRPGDVSALAEGMLRLARSPELVTEMRINLATLVADYGWEQHLNQLEEVYGLR